MPVLPHRLTIYREELAQIERCLVICRKLFTEEPSADELPAYCRHFLPSLEVSWVIRQDGRSSAEIAALCAKHAIVTFDPEINFDGIYYRLDPFSPWRGPFPAEAAAYSAAWTREVCE